MKRFTQFYAFLLISLLTLIANGQSYINGDTVRNPARTKTWAMPATSGTLVNAGSITNSDVQAGAGIVDSKLATISTAGKVSNSATTATSSNTASAIVARDANGNFAAGTITATTFQGNLPAASLTGTITNAQLAGSIDLTTKVTGALPIANGGSGQTSANAALNAFLPSQTGNSGKALITDGSGNTSWGSASGGGFFDKTQNLLSNSSFETNVSGWSASGGTLTQETGAANVEPPGVGALSWDSTAAGQTLSSNTITVTSGDGLSGRNGVFSWALKAAAGTATHLLEVIDGSGNTLTSQTITSQTSGFTRGGNNTLNFTFPTSGSVHGRLKSVASNEPQLFGENVYLGLADGFNISNVSQATLFGSIKWSSTSNCTWSVTGSFATPAADADCPTPTTTGFASAPSTKIPAIRFANGVPPGDYLIVSTGNFRANRAAATSADLALRISDGTNTFGRVTMTNFGSTSSATQQYGWMTFTARNNYANAMGDTTFAIQISATGTGNIDADGSDVEIQVYRFPPSSEQAIRPEHAAWWAKATISGANPSLGISAVSSYTEITDSGLTLTPASGSAPMGAVCSSTNAATTPSTGATTCAAGNEGIGANFDIKRAGLYEVCGHGNHFVGLDQAESINTAFQWVETPSNAQTLTLEGGQKVVTGGTALGIASGADAVNIYPLNVCGWFNWTSTGNKTVRLMYEQSIGGTPDTSWILADALSSVGQRDFTITVRPLTVGMNAPYLVGGVVAPDNTTGVTKINTINSSVKTSGYTATVDDETILVDANSSSWTLSLPAAASVKGKKYHILSTTAGGGARVIIDPNSSETVCGQTSITVAGLNDGVQIQSDGSNWRGLDGSCRREARARINCDSAATILDAGNNIITAVGNISGGGICGVTLLTGSFSSTSDLICEATWTGTGGTIPYAVPTSTTAVSLGAISLAGAASTTFDAGLTCSGAR